MTKTEGSWFTRMRYDKDWRIMVCPVTLWRAPLHCTARWRYDNPAPWSWSFKSRLPNGSLQNYSHLQCILLSLLSVTPKGLHKSIDAANCYYGNVTGWASTLVSPCVLLCGGIWKASMYAYMIVWKCNLVLCFLTELIRTRVKDWRQV